MDWLKLFFIRNSSKLDFLFVWLKLFYPDVKGVKNIFLLLYFFPQKILRINGCVKWPVHFTSRILYHNNIETGNRSLPGGSPGCYIQARNGIKIGHNLRMGPGVGLISSNHRLDDYDQAEECRPIVIGNNVWIGMNSVILPGVHIGNNVVIGANSVVKHDIPSNTIAAGNPCEVLRVKPPYTGVDYSLS